MHVNIFSLVVALALAGSAAAGGFTGTLKTLYDGPDNYGHETQVMELEQVYPDGSVERWQGFFAGFANCRDVENGCLIHFREVQGGNDPFFAHLAADAQGCQHIDFQSFRGYGAGACCDNPCHITT